MFRYHRGSVSRDGAGIFPKKSGNDDLMLDGWTQRLPKGPLFLARSQILSKPFARQFGHIRPIELLPVGKGKFLKLGLYTKLSERFIDINSLKEGGQFVWIKLNLR
jgi:hypothetical protein